MEECQFLEHRKVLGETITSSDETILPKNPWKYDLRDIYNEDEFGLSHEALLSEKLHITREYWSGGKYTKRGFTVMALSDAVGDMIFMFSEHVYKSEMFQPYFTLNVLLQGSKMTWWIGPAEDSLSESDCKYEKEGRKIVLIVDKCPTHYEVTRVKICSSLLPTIKHSFM